MRISELITVEKTNQFKAGDIITIDAQMGKGKSYWVKNILYAIAKRDNKKILFLIHRKTCLDQFQDELERDGKTDIITIKTYQHIDNTIKNQFKYDFSEYDIICSDESHYYFNDSWNRYSDLSLNAILNANDKIRIFMSATGDKTKRYIKEYKGLETIDYYIPRDYSFINHLEFFINKETIHKYIRRILSTNEKAIIFIKSAQRAYELFKMYEDDSLFLCSENNDFYKHVDVDKRNEMLENQMFEEKILFTTLTLEAGVDIIDSSLKHIIIDIGFNIESLFQAFGRKRVQDKTDGINLYLRAITNKQLGGVKSQLKQEYDFANDFLLTDNKEYIKKHYREQFRDLIYDEPTNFGYVKKLNITRFISIESDLKTIDEILEIDNKNLSYCKYISELLGVDYVVSEAEVQISELEIYLNSIASQELYKEERWELIQKVGLKDKQYRLQKGLNQLNAYFESNNIKYRLISERNMKRKLESGELNPNFKNTYWKVLS